MLNHRALLDPRVRGWSDERECGSCGCGETGSAGAVGSQGPGSVLACWASQSVWLPTSDGWGVLAGCVWLTRSSPSETLTRCFVCSRSCFQHKSGDRLLVLPAASHNTTQTAHTCHESFKRIFFWIYTRHLTAMSLAPNSDECHPSACVQRHCEALCPPWLGHTVPA